jgi:hypothetical protein
VPDAVAYDHAKVPSPEKSTNSEEKTQHCFLSVILSLHGNKQVLKLIVVNIVTTKTIGFWNPGLSREEELEID